MKSSPPSPVRKRTARSEKDHTFELIMQRFDTVDKDNLDIKNQVAAHVLADKTVHDSLIETVNKHKTYWGLALKISGVIFVAYIALLFR